MRARVADAESTTPAMSVAPPEVCSY